MVRIRNRKCPLHKFMHFREYNRDGSCPKCGGYFPGIMPIPQGTEFIQLIPYGNDMIVEYQDESAYYFKWAHDVRSHRSKVTDDYKRENEKTKTIS